MNGLIESALAHHRPRKVGNCAVSLLIEEVAPAAQSLTYQKADHHNVENGQKSHFLDFRDYESAGKRADDTAVYRQAALVDIENFDRMREIIIPLKNTEVQSRADNTGDKTDKDAVHQLAEIELKTRSGLVGVENCKHKTRRDDKSVPVDLE